MYEDLRLCSEMPYFWRINVSYLQWCVCICQQLWWFSSMLIIIICIAVTHLTLLQGVNYIYANNIHDKSEMVSGSQQNLHLFINECDSSWFIVSHKAFVLLVTTVLGHLYPLLFFLLFLVDLVDEWRRSRREMERGNGGWKRAKMKGVIIHTQMVSKQWCETLHHIPNEICTLQPWRYYVRTYIMYTK